MKLQIDHDIFFFACAERRKEAKECHTRKLVAAHGVCKFFYLAVIIETPNAMVEIMLVKNPIHLMAPPFLYRAVLTSRELSMYPFWYKMHPV